METQRKNLIINYLPPDFEEKDLRELFSVCGEIKDAKIVRDPQTRTSLGYGFVVFENMVNAVAAQILVDGHEVRGKKLKVAFARPRGEHIMNANLYLSFLPPNVDEEKLKELFGQCGKIIEAKVLRDKTTGESRGIGFIRFDLHVSALRARDTFNFYCFRGSTTPISVRFRQPRKPKEESENTTASDYLT
ncbi:hypothetical protein KR200_009041 [Drosophila serrata]|nr:hypothetical protein KR200_009041 [Drosophila serrata]